MSVGQMVDQTFHACGEQPIERHDQPLAQRTDQMKLLALDTFDAALLDDDLAGHVSDSPMLRT